MDKKDKLKKYKEDYAAIREILNEVDFLEVIPEGIKNEYEDLINPILYVLPQHPEEQVLADIIHVKLTCDYGMPGSIKTEDIAKKILNWWNKKMITSK